MNSDQIREPIASLVRRNRLILAGAAFILVCYILIRSWGILYPFIFGFILAYLVLPLVNKLERIMPRFIKQRHKARLVAILIVYLILLVILIFTIYLFLSVVIEQANRLTQELPNISRNITTQIDFLTQSNTLTNLLNTYQKNIEANLRQQIEGQMQKIGQQIAEQSLGVFQQGVMGFFDAVSKTISFLLGILIVPIWLFYILSDSSQLSKGFMNMVPLSMRGDVVAVLHIIDKITDAFVRGQLILCLIIGGASFLGLLVIGVPYSSILGIIAAITEAIPMIGPLLGMLPALLISLSQGPNALLITFILYMVIGQIESMLLKPHVMGDRLALHPAIFMVVLLIGASLGGVIGMILAAPITAILRDLFKYSYIRLSQENISPEETLKRINGEALKLDEI